MRRYRYILEPYKGSRSQHKCPKCNRSTYTRYIDSSNGKYIHQSVGRCSRAIKCSHNYHPYTYFKDNGITPEKHCSHYNLSEEQSKRDISFIPLEIFKQTLQGITSVSGAAQENNFISFLVRCFGEIITGQLIERYFIASSSHWECSTLFWQIDIKGRVRSGKIIQYDPINGKRRKHPVDHVTWIHRVLNLNGYYQSCLFGEHLLADMSMPVAIVESEKTAIIASAYLPQFIWLATGGIGNFTQEKCEVLRGRNVTVFPDLKGYAVWEKKSRRFAHITKFVVSDLLERHATTKERDKGLDIADHLLAYEYLEFVLGGSKTGIDDS